MATDPDQKTSLIDTPPEGREALAQRAANFTPPANLPSSDSVTPQMVLFEALDTALQDDGAAMKRVVVMWSDEDGNIDATWSHMSVGGLAIYARRLGTMVDMIMDDDDLPGVEEQDDDE